MLRIWLASEKPITGQYGGRFSEHYLKFIKPISVAIGFYSLCSERQKLKSFISQGYRIISGR